MATRSRIRFCIRSGMRSTGNSSSISVMPAPLHLVMILPKMCHLTAEEAARRLGVTLAETRGGQHVRARGVCGS